MARRLRLGIKARIGFVALAPTLAVALGTGSIAADKARTQHHVAALRAEVLHFEHELLLRAAIDSERASAETVARLPLFGVSATFASSFLGRDFDKDLALRRDRVDGLLANVAPSLRADVGPLLTRARDGAEGDRLDATALATRYDDASSRTRDDVERDLAALRGRVDRITGAGAVVTAAELARRASTVSQQGAIQSAQVADLAFTPETGREPKLAALMATHTRFEVARAALEGSGSSAGHALTELMAAPTVAEHVARVVHLAEMGDPAAVPDGAEPLRLAALFRGAFDFDDGLFVVAERAGADLVAATDAVADDAHRRVVSTLVVLALVLGGTLVVAIASAISLARPLRRLAVDVRLVQLGDLDHPIAQGSATTEIGILQRTLADLVANLRVVDQQAEALADGRLDAPVLAERVPGKLGAALQHSVARLSDAMAEERTLRERLAHEATHDSLTGLLNRAGVLARVGQVLASATRAGRGTALLFVDLDDFKRVNDDHGHAAGDAVLAAVATRLTAEVRQGDVIGRLGGDEFVVAMVDTERAEPAVVLAERLLTALREPVVVDGDACVVGASIGVALACDGGADPIALLEQADVAVLRAKAGGKHRVEVFDTELQRRSTGGRDWTTCTSPANRLAAVAPEVE